MTYFNHYWKFKWKSVCINANGLGAANGRLSQKLLGNVSAAFEIFGNFCDFPQLLKFSATFDFFSIFEIILYFFRDIY